MSGIPAGFEGGDSDDDFNYHDYEDVPYDNDFVEQKKIHSRLFGKSLASEEMKKEVRLDNEIVKSAIMKGDVDKLKNVLDQGFEVDMPLQSGWTSLMYAANNGFVEAVELLLKHKASPNYQYDLFTPVMAVCVSTNRNEDQLVSCIKMLIDFGAKINVHDRHLMTPLMYAAKQGYSKVVKVLCEHHADVNKQETRGWTALSFAAAIGLSHVVRILLEYKADVNIPSFDGQKPADVAFSHSFTMLSELLEKYDGDHTEQFADLPSDESSIKNSAASKYVKYGDLELFLHGLELGHIVPLIQEQQLELKDLLKVTEQEMIEMGITQLGVRKKLLAAIRDVHSNEWDMKSLSVENISKLTTLETAAVVANITKHLDYLRSSVVYINRHLHLKKAELCADNTRLQKTLVDQCSEAFKISSALQKDITLLNKDAVRMFPNIDKKSADLLDDCYTTTNTSKHLLYISAGTGMFLLCGAIVGYQLVYK